MEVKCARTSRREKRDDGGAGVAASGRAVGPDAETPVLGVTKDTSVGLVLYLRAGVSYFRFVRPPAATTLPVPPPGISCTCATVVRALVGRKRRGHSRSLPVGSRVGRRVRTKGSVHLKVAYPSNVDSSCTVNFMLYQGKFYS